MAEKKKRTALYSGAVQLKPSKNQRWGKTIGTLKLFENEKYDGEENHPTMNGYIIINLTDDKENAQFYPVSVWGKLPE
jgi:hypothetical protein